MCECKPLTPERLEEIKRAWDYYKHEDSNLSARTSYGIVTQSLLALSYVTLVNYQVYERSILAQGIVATIQVLICTFAIWYSLRHLGMIDQVQAEKHHLEREYLVHDPIFRSYREAGQPFYQTGRRDVPKLMAEGWKIAALAAVALVLVNHYWGQFR